MALPEANSEACAVSWQCLMGTTACSQTDGQDGMMAESQPGERVSWCHAGQRRGRQAGKSVLGVGAHAANCPGLRLPSQRLRRPRRRMEVPGRLGTGQDLRGETSASCVATSPALGCWGLPAPLRRSGGERPEKGSTVTVGTGGILGRPASGPAPPTPGLSHLLATWGRVAELLKT